MTSSENDIFYHSAIQEEEENIWATLSENSKYSHTAFGNWDEGARKDEQEDRFF